MLAVQQGAAATRGRPTRRRRPRSDVSPHEQVVPKQEERAVGPEEGTTVHSLLSEQRVGRRDILKAAVGAGAALATGMVAAACGSGSSGPAATASGTSSIGGTPKPGGDLRVALTAGSSGDTLNAGAGETLMDAERLYALYNGVCRLTQRADGIELDLAEEITPNATATQWTIRVKPGITFHNGKDLTAEDVAFTF